MIEACIERARFVLARAVEAANKRRATAFDPLRGLYVTEAEVEQILTRDNGVAITEHPFMIPQLRRITDAPELHDAIAIAVAAEYVPRLDRVFGFLHDDLTRRTLSVGLLVEILSAAPSHFARDGMLAQLAVIAITPSDTPLGDCVRADAGFLSTLSGEERLDARIRQYAAEIHRSNGTARTQSMPQSPLVLWGAAGEDLAAAARRICDECGCDAVRLSAGADPQHIGIAAREAIVRDAILLLETPDPAKACTIAAALEPLAVTAILEASGGIVGYSGRSLRVTRAAQTAPSPPAGYPLPYGRRMVARRTMDDLVLPSAALLAVRSIAERMAKRDLVTRVWGVDTGSSIGGVRALFAGPPGTGKTLAAEALAHALRRDLYIVDLSMVVSKYIGETEKALATIFAEASRARVCLFFDEADALFGKRTRTKDAHDRYANIETAYLLQALDLYPDITILATNLPDNIDDALTRRIDVKVEFAMPDAGAREKIWRRSLGNAPLADVDLNELANRLQLSGGAIQTSALAAAYRAAGEQRAIETMDLLRAARDELAKTGRVAGRVELGQYDARLRAESHA